MLSMGGNKYLHVEFLNINTLLVTYQIKNLDIHKLSIEFWYQSSYYYLLSNKN
jgi:hypothetical protein